MLEAKVDVSLASDAKLVESNTDDGDIKCAPPAADPLHPSALTLAYCPGAWGKRFAVFTMSPYSTPPGTKWPGPPQGKPPDPKLEFVVTGSLKSAGAVPTGRDTPGAGSDGPCRGSPEGQGGPAPLRPGRCQPGCRTRRWRRGWMRPRPSSLRAFVGMTKIER